MDNHRLVNGAGPYVVKRGGLEVFKRVPVHERVRNTVLLLRGSLSMFLVEVPVRSTSPHMAKSLESSTSVDTIRGYTISHTISP
jgi:hypothetical protein